LNDVGPAALDRSPDRSISRDPLFNSGVIDFEVGCTSEHRHSGKAAMLRIACPAEGGRTHVKLCKMSSDLPMFRS
jgi:hypothetical protein